MRLSTAGKRHYARRNTLLHEMGFRSYHEYLKSDLWKSIRARVYAIRGKMCCVCRINSATAIHHVQYTKNNLRGKKLKHLIPICCGCHERIEFLDNGDKASLGIVRQRMRKLQNGVPMQEPSWRKWLKKRGLLKPAQPMPKWAKKQYLCKACSRVVSIQQWFKRGEPYTCPSCGHSSRTNFFRRATIEEAKSVCPNP